MHTLCNDLIMLTFSDTTNYDGHIQEVERIVYSADYGRVSGNTKLLAMWTVLMNQGLERATALMSEYAGFWRIGDWNHGTYDTATQNIVSGTREVAITNPENVLFIFDVSILDSATATDYVPIKPFSIKDRDTYAYRANQAAYTSVPYRYEKVGGYIVLDPEPNYSATNGVRYTYQRAPHPFATSDTTAVAAIPSLFDPLINLYAIDAHATADSNATLKSIVGVDIARLERDIKNFMRARSEMDKVGGSKMRVVSRPSR